MILLTKDIKLYKGLGIRLKLFRNMYGKTQKELAEEIGISQTTLAQYENGNKKMPIEKLVQFAKYFNTTTDDILGLNFTDETYYSTNNPRLIEQHQKWYTALGNVEFSYEEFEELMDFAKYIIYKREK